MKNETTITTFTKICKKLINIIQNEIGVVCKDKFLLYLNEFIVIIVINSLYYCNVYVQ